MPHKDKNQQKNKGTAMYAANTIAEMVESGLGKKKRKLPKKAEYNREAAKKIKKGFFK